MKLSKFFHLSFFNYLYALLYLGEWGKKECFLNLDNNVKLEKINFLKIDAEGAEYDILLKCPSEVLNN